MESSPAYTKPCDLSSSPEIPCFSERSIAPTTFTSLQREGACPGSQSLEFYILHVWLFPETIKIAPHSKHLPVKQVLTLLLPEEVQVPLSGTRATGKVSAGSWMDGSTKAWKAYLPIFV